VVRRDLGVPLMRACSAGFRRSIDAAFAHEDEAIRYALQFGRGLDAARGKTFVHMYVNELTLDIGARGRAGLQLLYDRALACGAIAKAPDFDVV